MKLVTIIIPYKTDRGYLDIAIESVKAQSYPNIELIIQQGDKSVSANINDGIRKAKGDYIKYLCEDDYLTINSIEDSVKAMEGNDFIHGISYNIFEDRKELHKPRIKYPTLSDMLIGNVIHGGTLMYRKEVFDKVGLFNEELTCAEEYEFNLRCLRYGMKLGFTDKILYNYRRHKEQKSLGIGIDQRDRAMKVQSIKDSIKPLKVVVAVATFKGREEFLKCTIKSIANQCDVLRIYNNEERDVDLTDNGKFYFLQEYTEPIYYFTIDDDIIYPPTYVRDMIQAIERHKTIVTHHGRILVDGQTRYYGARHKTFACLKENRIECLIDVAGTGVTAFRTDYFNPSHIWQSDNKRMSDCVFSLEAAKRNKKITVLRHNSRYFEYQKVPLEETIFGQDFHNDSVQTSICNEILRIKKAR
jgi:GT2 family glycosyltransferase